MCEQTLCVTVHAIISEEETSTDVYSSRNEEETSTDIYSSSSEEETSTDIYSILHADSAPALAYTALQSSQPIVDISEIPHIQEALGGVEHARTTSHITLIPAGPHSTEGPVCMISEPPEVTQQCPNMGNFGTLI